MASSVLETLSNEYAAAAEAVGGSVVAIYGRRWLPSSGIQWRKGVIVTAHHSIRREEDIAVVLEGGKIVEGETPLELVRRRGRYASFFDLQSGAA